MDKRTTSIGQAVKEFMRGQRVCPLHCKLTFLFCDSITLVQDLKKSQHKHISCSSYTKGCGKSSVVLQLPRLRAYYSMKKSIHPILCLQNWMQPQSKGVSAMGDVADTGTSLVNKHGNAHENQADNIVVHSVWLVNCEPFTMIWFK